MKEIVPVLLGADLNCYNVARAFHEQYGVTSYAFGRYAVSATKYSHLIHFTVEPQIDSEDVMLTRLTAFAEEHKDKMLILFGCTDDYAAMIIRNKSKLPQYLCACPDVHFLDTVSRKADFYETCEQYGIPHPKTVVLTTPASAAELSAEKLGFGYPMIVKPSSSVVYWKHPFDGMKKVYIAKNVADAEKIIADIYKSGYDDKMILQEFIPGGDDHMRVLTCFSDAKGKVRAMCLGHTMIEEHTPHGLGNHAAIVTEPISTLPFAENIRAMLEGMGYTGFSNFDIKVGDDPTDFRAFEINLRQGRSNYYVTASGLNIARLVAEVYNSDGTDCVMNENEVFWHHVPKSVAYTYTESPALVARAKELAAAGKEQSSLWYKPDFKGNPLRFICVAEILRRQKQKFKQYYPKKG